jgi:diacylglycerol kinase (ATP)
MKSDLSTGSDTESLIACPIIQSIACTAERFFRIDRAQEHLHFVVDICTDDLYILDPEIPDEDIFESGSESSYILDAKPDSDYQSGDGPPASLRPKLNNNDNPFNVPQDFSTEEVLHAAKHGDLSLLKQLHHKGVNLMAIDDNGML